ncbi:ankyrin repeat-containing domain protein [Fusarium oxysporum f. sp. albedinis]|nr:ankyrin repeat-containing domain protein [Fusarium oxysporum f. sp. albedinis]
MNHGRIYFRAEAVSRGADNIRSPQICVAGRPLTLTNFPPEIIKCIIDKILDENSLHKEESWEWDYWSEPEPEHNPLQVYVDVLNLAATCKDIRRPVTKQIYIRDARDNHSAALLVSAKRNDIAGVIRALHIGANIHSDDATETVTYYTTGPNAIKTGYRVPLQLENQATAIHWAAFNGHKEIVSLLLNHGASINHRVSIGTRLRCLGSLQAVDNQYRFMKLEQGANTLYFAVKGGNIDIAESLIKAGAELMTHTGTGLTALHQAVSNGDISMAKDLLMEGIDPNNADPFGKTPLHFIKCSEEEMAHPAVKMIKTLVEHGADINRCDLLGNTPLLTHLQDFERNDSVIAEFIRQGAHIYEGFYDDLEAPLNELNQECHGIYRICWPRLRTGSSAA